MKLLCETAVRYRLNATGSNQRAQKSTLVLARSPNKTNPDAVLILFTATNKTGTRYKISNNIEKVFTKFLHEGKTTISLREPVVDIQIRCNAMELKGFLKTLKITMEGKCDQINLGMSAISATAIPESSHPIRKLLIKDQGDYPLRGLPRTLQSLVISGIKRARVDSQIFFLKNLTSLSLSDNIIEDIPKQLGQLRLTDIDFSNNELGTKQHDARSWEWLLGAPLAESLQYLNLSSNKVCLTLMNEKKY